MNDLLKCMKLCQKSYKKKYGDNDINKIMSEFIWYKNVEFFTCLDSKKNLYIVFKGSSGLGDWADNLKFLFKKFQGFKIHSGHLGQFRIVQNKLFNIILDHHQKYKSKIYITGHSLGGAIANIAGLFIAKYYKFLLDDLYIYSYGANKTFNWKTVKFFNKHIKHCVRCVNEDDFIPKLPPKTSLGGLLKNISFFHVKNKVRVGKKEPWWYFIRVFSNIKKDIKSHYPDKYIKNIENNLT